MNDIFPCHFCQDSFANIELCSDDYYVICSHCGCQGPEFSVSSYFDGSDDLAKDKAISAWNFMHAAMAKVVIAAAISADQNNKGGRL